MYDYTCVLVAPDIILINRLALLHIVCFGAKSSYYYAWLISKQLFTRMILNCCLHCAVDSACNAAGLGFSGYNKLGYAEWNLVSSVDVFAFEVKPSNYKACTKLYHCVHSLGQVSER